MVINLEAHFRHENGYKSGSFMRNTFALLAVVVIFLLAEKPTVAAPGAPAVGDQLSLSITNKYLPPDIRQKYQPLATGVIKQQEKEGAADAAYLDYTRQLQAQKAQHLAAQEAQENQQATERAESQAVVTPKYVVIPIPNQNWKLTIADFGFGNWAKQEDNNQFVLHGQTGPGGLNLVLFVENPVNTLSGNDPVYNFYWSNMAHDSLIDAQSVKVERTDKFIKVSYFAQNQPNVNYFFAYQGKWVDVHLSKGVVEPGDDKLFAAFDAALSYGP